MSPNINNKINEMFLKIFKSRLKIWTNFLEKKVKRAKVTMNPIMIPIGRFLPPSIDPDKIMGKIGKMQGEIIKTNPSKKARIKVSSSCFIGDFSYVTMLKANEFYAFALSIIC